MQSTSQQDYKALYEQSQLQVLMLQHRLDQLEKMIFGSRHERFVAPAAGNTAQMSLDLQTEVVAKVKVTHTKQISYTRTKTVVDNKPVVHNGRGRLPDHLRREDIVLEPDDLPEGSIKIGELVTEQLECTPSELYVKRYIRYKYKLPAGPESDSTAIVSAPLPVQPIDKCIAGPGLLAQILIDKYLDHLPVHRQMHRFERSGVKLPYSTIVEWNSGACKLLEVLYDALKAELLVSSYLHVDETTIRVLDQDKKGKKIHTGFFWVYNNSALKLVFFDYQPTRNKDAPAGILREFKGYLQTDGYEAYEQFDRSDDIIQLHCMAHARRYFVDALATDPTRAGYVLEQMQQLYAVERSCTEKQLSFQQRKVVRQQQSMPILEALGSWMKHEYTQPGVLPKSPIGVALAYSIKRWEKLMRYTQDGMLLIDNNAVENSIRPVALGRKNYLFCGSHEAAQRTAVIYSLLGTCKIQGINPYVWLKDVLTRIAAHPINKIKELLPHHWKQLQVPAAEHL